MNWEKVSKDIFDHVKNIIVCGVIFGGGIKVYRGEISTFLENFEFAGGVLIFSGLALVTLNSVNFIKITWKKLNPVNISGHRKGPEVPRIVSILLYFVFVALIINVALGE